MFRFSLQLLSETFLILRRTERDIIQNVYRSSCKVPAILVRFEWNLNFLDRFLKNTQVSNFVEIRLEREREPSCSVRSDIRMNGQTNRRHEGNSRFSRFFQRAKKKDTSASNILWYLHNFENCEKCDHNELNCVTPWEISRLQSEWVTMLR